LEKLYFSENLYKQQKFISEYFSYIINFFRKPISEAWKGFGKPLINWWFYKRFISDFPKPFYVSEIGFQNSFITTAAGFQHGFGPIRTSENLGNLLINL
jgi:hypothetical protein